MFSRIALALAVTLGVLLHAPGAAAKAKAGGTMTPEMEASIRDKLRNTGGGGFNMGGLNGLEDKMPHLRETLEKLMADPEAFAAQHKPAAAADKAGAATAAYDEDEEMEKMEL